MTKNCRNCDRIARCTLDFDICKAGGFKLWVKDRLYDYIKKFNVKYRLDNSN